MSIQSKHLKKFIEEIKYVNRNPQKLRALDLLNDRTTNPQIIIGTSDTLYRARIITDKTEINKENGFYGYNAKNSFVPPVKKTRDFRANYRYIPYLYCANHPYVALVEVRPRLGASVSIATISVDTPLVLLDFTIQNEPKKMSVEKRILFEDLSSLFSKPVTSDDDIIDYIPTQFIAEYAKKMGYDGIAFSSSLTPEFSKYKFPKYNVVVFNYDKCSVSKSNVFKVAEMYLEARQIDEDSTHLLVNSFLDDALDELHAHAQFLINGEQ